MFVKVNGQLTWPVSIQAEQVLSQIDALLDRRDQDGVLSSDDHRRLKELMAAAEQICQHADAQRQGERTDLHDNVREVERLDASGNGHR